MRTIFRRLLAVSLPVLLALAVPLLFVCCTQQWLPDSSGFVFVSSGGAVTLYNLKTKETTQLAAGKFPHASVAVWPSGDRVVVSRLAGEGRDTTIQLVLYDLKGKQLHASPRHALGTAKQIETWGHACYASPDEKHAVAFFPQSGRAVIYNIVTRQFRSINKVVPIAHYGNPQIPLVDVSPITPDGRGFVAARRGAETVGLVLVLWNGEVKNFATDVNVKGRAKPLGQQKSGLFTALAWEMSTLAGRADRGVITINPDTLKVSYSESAQTIRLQDHAKRHGVYVLCELEHGAIVQLKDQEVQLWRPGGAGAAAILQLKGGFPLVVPAPNRRSILVRTVGDRDQLVVIDINGQKLVEMK